MWSEILWAGRLESLRCIINALTASILPVCNAFLIMLLVTSIYAILGNRSCYSFSSTLFPVRPVPFTPQPLFMQLYCLYPTIIFIPYSQQQYLSNIQVYPLNPCETPSRLCPPASLGRGATNSLESFPCPSSR